MNGRDMGGETQAPSPRSPSTRRRVAERAKWEEEGAAVAVRAAEEEGAEEEGGGGGA